MRRPRPEREPLVAAATPMSTHVHAHAWHTASAHSSTHMPCSGDGESWRLRLELDRAKTELARHKKEVEEYRCAPDIGIADDALIARAWARRCAF